MANMLDRAVASMPIVMILVACTLTKMGCFSWGLAWIAGLCLPVIMTDLLNSRQNPG
jgi:ABC-type bacteriocin/lantibiotic exporter with double-glycine peptidase domain